MKGKPVLRRGVVYALEDGTFLSAINAQQRKVAISSELIHGPKGVSIDSLNCKLKIITQQQVERILATASEVIA